MDTRISWLELPGEEQVTPEVRRLWQRSEEVLGFVPNVFRAQALNPEQFAAWWAYFNLLVNKEGFLARAERELIAVVVSAANGCLYCTVSHAAALRAEGVSAENVDALAINHRAATLTARERALAEFADKLTRRPAEMLEADLEALRAVGLDDHAILEATQVVAMFNATNRISGALGFVPNPEYYGMGR
ncbi:putative peroxidase-related enzyme [Deinobacterium chartae]|uniref:Putative peroxidase-related enzyme n=1 Tax=Deinobacterium chartae TaxID=521158 RepID=A0A841I1U1_9DEIO|nr:peroxidase-related enzyme [Deinobacterium chartae]MBB6099657.1 putative peroxidase-related enzyme [Deinobacterium chartae]